jgi:hypothetical protein
LGEHDLTDRGDSEGNTAATPRIALPKNIAQTLKFLDDVDLETLRLSVDSEVRRRRSARGGEAAVEQSGDDAPQKRQGKKSTGTRTSVPLPVGKASLIRASAKSGLKPQAIARTLRISLLEVNRVLGVAAKRKR